MSRKTESGNLVTITKNMEAVKKNLEASKKNGELDKVRKYEYEEKVLVEKYNKEIRRLTLPYAP